MSDIRDDLLHEIGLCQEELKQVENDRDMLHTQANLYTMLANNCYGSVNSLEKKRDILNAKLCMSIEKLTKLNEQQIKK